MVDRREEAWDPFYGSFDEQTMTGVLYGSASPEDEDAVIIHCHWEVCDVCDGRGHHVHPGVDSHGISAREFDEDPDFEESYRSGTYNVNCYRCGGLRVIPVPDEDDPNLEEYISTVNDHYESLAEREAERRVGA